MTEELARDLDSSIGGILDLLADRDEESDLENMQMINVVRPQIRAAVSRSTEPTLKALALIHLETGALINKHAEEDPEKLIRGILDGDQKTA